MSLLKFKPYLSNYEKLNNLCTNITKAYSSKAGSSRKVHSNFNYCVDLVKTNDFDLYLSTLLSPTSVLRASFAVRAFNIELLSIGKSRDLNVAHLKLQFWKDQLDRIFDKGLNNDVNLDEVNLKSRNLNLYEPVSNELAAIVKEFKLSRVWFNRLIDARRQFFHTHQFRSLDELEKCADASMASEYYILFNCMNVKSVDCDHAASHLGKAQMISSIVRGVLRRASQSVYYLPMDLMIRHKISQQDLISFSGPNLKAKSQNLKDLTFEMCTRANQHLNSSRELSKKIPREVKPLFASAFNVEVFLNKMEKYDFDLTNPKLKSDFRTQKAFKLLLAKFRNTY